MSIMLTDETTPEMIYRARDLGVLIAKLYPKGATTNSGKGVSRIFGPRMEANYQAMTECGLVLGGHFENPLGDIMDREAEFVSLLDNLVSYFPHLRIIAEHVTTAELMAWVLRQGPQVVCTVTPQHLVCTRNDVLGIQGLQDPELPRGGPTLTDGLTSPAIRPHYYCLPVAKTMADRRALILAAISGDRKVCLGTDSAPHDPTAKECAYGCAGVFVPGKIALATLAWVFELCGPVDWPRRLRAFACENWINFHRLPPVRGTITLRKQAWTVPARIAGFVPFAAEHTLPWEPFRDV
jgi:dihydroorotase